MNGAHCGGQKGRGKYAHTDTPTGAQTDLKVHRHCKKNSGVDA